MGTAVTGFTWRGVTVTNPFSADRHPLLRALVDGHTPTDRKPRTSSKSTRRRTPR